MTILEEKKILRNQIKFKLNDFCKNQNELYVQKSQNLCDKILENSIYKNSKTIFAYFALKNELNIDKIIEKALYFDKKNVCVPKIIPNTNKMDFYFLDSQKSLKSQIDFGAFNIREPKEFLKKVDFNKDFQNQKDSNSYFFDSSLVLIPGLLFTKNGNRLGKGKGFYDSFINNFLDSKNFKLCGICFDFQITQKIPLEKHDKKMDFVFFS